MVTQTTILSNGITIVSDAVQTVETVAIGVWFKVGTRHESYEINGISHVLEHMAFRGTDRHTSREIAEKIEAVGGHLNAYTAREHTAYYARILKEDLSLAVDILADILQFSVFREEELERERTVILQEIAQAHDTPDDIIFDHFQETAFPNQALGYPIIGRTEVIKTLSRNDILAYQEDKYAASNMIIAAAGNICHQSLAELVSEKFTHLKLKAHVPYSKGTYKGGDLRVMRDLEQVHLVLGFPSVELSHQDYYATSALATILGGGMSSRLFQEVREKRGLVYEIQSFVSGFKDCSIFGIYANAGPKQARSLIPVVCEELMKFSSTISEEELDRAKAQLKAAMMMALESTTSRCEQLAQQVMIYGRPLSTREILNSINEINRETLKKLAQSIFSHPSTFTALGPIKELDDYENISKHLT